MPRLFFSIRWKQRNYVIRLAVAVNVDLIRQFDGNLNNGVFICEFPGRPIVDITYIVVGGRFILFLCFDEYD